MKKILQVVCSYFPRIGGIEQVARDISDALKDEPYEMKVICLNENAEAEGMVCKRNETVYDTVDGVEVIRCGSIAKVASQLISPKYISELRKIMNSYEPDIVIFHYPNPFLAQFLLSYKRRPFKLVVYWHLDITKQKILGKLFHPQTLALIKRADKIVGATTNHINESAYTKYFGEKKYILPYMISQNRITVSQEELAAAEKLREKYGDKIVGFFIGRHVPYKGLTYLIQASKLLDDRFRFIIAGCGPLTDELKQQAEGDSKIEFVGKISDSKMREYLTASDIFCFPSITRNEAFGLALAEVMYFEKPAVTFTIKGSGVNCVNIDGVTGIECPNGDVKAYADALKKLADNKELREEYGRNAKLRIEENFTFDIFRKNITELLGSL